MHWVSACAPKFHKAISSAHAAYFSGTKHLSVISGRQRACTERHKGSTAREPSEFWNTMPIQLTQQDSYRPRSKRGLAHLEFWTGKNKPILTTSTTPNATAYVEEKLQRTAAWWTGPCSRWYSGRASSAVTGAWKETVCSINGFIIRRKGVGLLYLLEEWHYVLSLLGGSLGRFLAACCFTWSVVSVSVGCWLWLAWKSWPGTKRK